MSNLVTFSKAGLPAVSTLASSLRALQSDVGPAGVVIVKMDKTGHWVFGADQTEVEDDNPDRACAGADAFKRGGESTNSWQTSFREH